MTPTFSIIIPVYNVVPYLRECLDSVLAQTYTDWEAICVDDGSTDGSGAILDEYAAKDKRFRVMHQANAGTHLARLRGLDASFGKWIGFQDADDVIDAKRFEVFAKRIKETSADIVLGDVVERRVDGRFFYHPFSRALSGSRALNGREILHAMLNSNGAEYEWHVLYGRVFRRDVVDRAMKFLRREQGHFVMCEDVGWSIVLSLCGGRLAFAHGAPYVYFRNPESSTCANPDIKGFEKVADHFKQSIRLAHAALAWGKCSTRDHELVNAWFHRYLEGWEWRRRKSFSNGVDIFLPLIHGKIGKTTDPIYGCAMSIDEKDIIRAHLLTKSAKLHLFCRMLRAWLRIVLYPIVIITRPIRHRKVKR